MLICIGHSLSFSYSQCDDFSCSNVMKFPIIRVTDTICEMGLP